MNTFGYKIIANKEWNKIIKLIYLDILQNEYEKKDWDYKKNISVAAKTGIIFSVFHPFYRPDSSTACAIAAIHAKHIFGFS